MGTAKGMVSLPWMWAGPTETKDEHGNVWWELRIEELPDFFVAGASREEVLAEAATALEAFLESFLSAGEQPPLPTLIRTQDLPLRAILLSPRFSSDPAFA